MRLTEAAIAGVVLLLAGGCGTGSTQTGSAGSRGQVTSPPSAAATRSPTPESRPETDLGFGSGHQRDDAAAKALFPPGYPRVVPVGSLPFELRHSYSVRSHRAVALAPGVWAPLPAGASVMDAASTGVADGRCGAVRAYERRYLGGHRLDGDCW